MAKENSNSTILLIKTGGFERWALKAGYEKALVSTRRALDELAATVERAGGRLLSFEGEDIALLFAGSGRSSILSALEVAEKAVKSLKNSFAKDFKAEFSALAHSFFLKQETLKSASALVAQTKAAAEFAAKCARNARPGPTLLTPEASAAAGDGIVEAPGFKSKSYKAFSKISPGQKYTPRKLPGLKANQEIAGARLEPLRLAAPVEIAILARKPSKTGDASRRNFEEAVKSFGGIRIEDPKGACLAVFHDADNSSSAAMRAVRCAFSVSGDGDSPDSGAQDGVFGVAAGVAPLGSTGSHSGNAFKAVLARAVALSQARAETRVLADSAAHDQAGFALSTTPAEHPIKGIEAFGVNQASQEMFCRGALGVPPWWMPVKSASLSKKSVEAFKTAADSKKGLLLGYTSDLVGMRLLAAMTLTREGRTRKFRILSSPAESRSSLEPLGVWKPVVEEIAGLTARRGQESLKARLAAAVQRAAGGRDRFLEQALMNLFYAPQHETAVKFADPKIERILAEKAILLLLRKAASEGPLAVLFPEFHHADRSSVELLLKAREFLKDNCAVLACIYQPPLRTRKFDAEVPLEPLSKEAMADLAKAVSGCAPETERKKAAEDSKGDPLQFAERIRGGEKVFSAKTPQGDGAQARREAVIRRMRLLSSSNRKALLYAAVCGQVSQPRTLGKILGADGLKAVRELEASGWLFPWSLTGGGEWAFSDSTVRGIIAGLAGGKEKAAIIEQALASVRERFQPASIEASYLSGWLITNGQNRRQAAEALLDLARKAMESGFPQEAETCAGEALSLPGLVDQDKSVLLYEKARALADLGRNSEALTAVESALRTKSIREVKTRKKKAPTSLENL